MQRCEYVEWARSVPPDPRYDLTRSGIADTAGLADAAFSWIAQPEVAAICRRESRAQIMAEYANAVARRYNVDAHYVTPTLGGTQAILHSLFALVGVGDHVVVERPTYEPLYRVPELLGAEVSRLERKPKEQWAVLPERLAQLLTPRTRAVILTNLHNPTGLAIPTDTLAQVGDMAARVGAALLVDEVNLDFCFGQEAPLPTQPACLAVDNGVSWSSVSKCFGFSALRAGWIVTRHDEVAAAMRSATPYLHLELPMTPFHLATQVLSHADELRDRASRVADNGRRIVNRWLEAERRVSWISPPAGLTGIVQLPPLMSDRKFSGHLRERYDTQVVPGSLFEASGTVRLSYGLPEPELEQALANFSGALDELI